MKTSTAKVSKPGESPRYVPSVVNYRGYMAQEISRGIGKPIIKGGFNSYGEGETWEEYDKYETVYKPFFNKSVIADINYVKEKYANLDIRELVGTEAEAYLIKWGENEGGMIVEDTDELRKREEEVKQREIIEGKSPVNFFLGYFGLRIAQRLPADIWNKIKDQAEYHKGDESDMEFLDDMGFLNVNPREVRGWTYKASAVDTLIESGLKVTYRNFDINSSADLHSVDERIQKEQEELKKLTDEVNTVYSKFIERLAELYLNSERTTEEESDRVSRLEMLTIPGWEGPNIYGGGRWMHIKGDDLYLVRNNGMDGDNWNLNNYKTGGAGAICVKLLGSASLFKEISYWLNSIGTNAALIKT